MTTFERNQVIRNDLLNEFDTIHRNKRNIKYSREFLEDYYSIMSLKAICVKYNISVPCITKRIEALNYPPKKSLNFHKVNYRVDEGFFEVIDTEAKSYFLGLLFADGFITKSNNVKRMGISLNNRDKYMLEEFRKVLGADNPLTAQNEKDQHRLLITSKKMFDDLYKLGCVTNKSLILKFPKEEDVPEHLVHHFIRGYFDGDGCIGVYGKHNTKCLSFAGTEHFLLQVKQEIANGACIEKGKIKKVKNIFILSYHSREDIKKIGEYFYRNATIFMKRKNDKFLI